MSKSNQPLGDVGLDEILKDRGVRQAVARQSHLMFFHIYFPHYVKFPLAEFQKDIFRITEDASNKLACIVAFRGSAKSTIVTLSYSLWSILGIQQKKFALIICRTQAQARQQMMNIRNELENNRYLRNDLGPFQEDSGGEWAASSIVFRNTDARIMVASLDQSIRGVRHHEHRPDLIILDDVEDVSSTKTYESRQKNFEWLTREVMPLGDMGTRVIIVANMLHEDSLVMRLRKKIEADELSGTYREFPLLDKEKGCLWPGKFDSPNKIEELRRSVANEIAWQQEYLLNPVTEEMRVIHPEWIQYYDQLPPSSEFRIACTAVDLAISEKETADYTAIVTAGVYGYGDRFGVYIQPKPVNKRLSFPDLITLLRQLDDAMRQKGGHSLIVEDVGYQRSVIQQLRRHRVFAKGVSTDGLDKRTRLALISELVRDGVVRFPRVGCEGLVAQLTGFGNERHDDLADAFSMLMKEVQALPRLSLSKGNATRKGGTIVGNLMERRW